MIKSVGPSYGSPVDLGKLREGSKAKAAASVGQGAATSSGASSTSASVSNMASEGAPVDFDKVLAIKEAIAAGKYPVDANKLADRMVALDLGE